MSSNLPYLYVIVLLHAGFAGALLLLHWQRPSRFVQRFAWSWLIEAVRAAILLPEVHNLGGRSGEWFCLADMLCFLSNWFIFSAGADLVSARFPRWLAPVYFGASIPMVLLGRYVAPIILQDWFGWTLEQGRLHGVLGNLVIMFVPVTAARIIIMVWLLRLWRETRLPGALIAALFCVPYAVIAMAVPFQFYFSYNPSWVALLWVFRVFGFSIGIVMLLLSRQQSALDQTGQFLRAIIDNEPECVKLVDADGSLRLMNPAGLGMFEADSFDQIAKHGIYPLIVPEHRAAFQELTARVFRGESGTMEFQIAGLKGTPRWLETHATPMRDDLGKVVSLLSITRDITARKQAEAIIACQTKVLEMMATGVPLAATLTAMLQSIEAFAPGMLGSIVLLDADGVHVRHGVAPSLPDSFNHAIEGQPIGPRAGSCGTAAFRREPVIVEDIATDPLWSDYRELALAHGLRACWSTPIFDEHQRVLGTFAIYYREPGLPTALHRRCIALATSLATIAIGRNRAEEVFHRQQVLLTTVVEGTSDAVFAKDLAGRYQIINAAGAQALGKTAADVIGRPDAELIPAEVARRFRETDEEVIASGQIRMQEEQAVFSTGTRYFFANKAPWRDAAGRIIGTIGVSREITERKQAESELREAEARLRLSVAASNIGLWDWNLATNDVYFSREWKAQIGYAEDEISNRFEEWESRVHPDNLAPTLAKLRAFIDEPDAAYAVEFRLRHKDGSYRWIFTQAKISRDAAGKPLRMMGCHIDITERKQVETALRSRKEQLSLIYENVHDIIFVVDVAPDGDFRFSSVNSQFMKVTGLTEGQVVGLRVADTIPASAHALVLSSYRESIRTGRPVTWEEVTDYPSGRKCAVVTVAPVCDAQGNCAQLIGTVHDITERQRAQEELEESREQLRSLLARLQHAREQERARVSREIHDELGQLLTGLKMDVRWLERKLSEPGLPPRSIP